MGVRALSLAPFTVWAPQLERVRLHLNARMPRRAAPPGERHSQMLMPTSSSAMNTKKAAVCHVHAIQLIGIDRASPRALPSSHTRPSENPFAM